jgi:hypothetical protein
MVSFRAHLSPNEETTLRRVAISTLEQDDIRDADAVRLKALGLIREADGLLIPTSSGLERLQIKPPPPSRPPTGRRQKVRKSPF